MEKVTYIIPIHELKEDTKKLLATALESLENVSGDADDELLLVGPLDIIKEIFVWYSEEKENSRFKEIGLVPNDGSTDFFTQVNLAAKKCSTKYFSILEFDDTYEPYWNKTVQEYAESTGASVVLPLNAFIVNGEFSSFGNEVVWSTTFAQSDNEVLGYVSEDCLNTFIDFNVTGALINTADFNEIGGLKPSLKISAWYEFLFRCLYNSKLVYVAPKVCYNHTIGRKGSYSDVAYSEIGNEEGQWLIKAAKQEYFFKEDRHRTFGDDIEEVTEEVKE